MSIIGRIALIWFLVVTLPGPNFVVVTQASMARSRQIGFYMALGVSAGAGIWAAASLLGLGALFRYAGWLYGAVRIVGGCYLVYMGLTTVLRAARPLAATHSPNGFSGGSKAAFKKGILTSFSNPKTAAFFGSLFLSTFPAQAPLWFNAVAVMMVVAVSIGWYSLAAYCFSFGMVKRAYQSARRPLDVLTGSMLAFFGCRLIFAKD